MYTDDYQTLFDVLSRHRIPYEKHVHEAVRTMEDCYRVQTLAADTVMPKNILLCNRQGTAFFLFVCAPFLPFRTAVFSKALGVSRLSFAADGQLEKLLHVSSGALTPLSLLFDKDKQVRLVLDQTLLQASCLAFHPLVPTETLIFRKEDFLDRFLPLTGHPAEFVLLKEPAQ